ncbi:uncharacterized protein LOC122856520 [Aphidius gifuensis]|uniref:uncharacterized protein LOC122856520 n=1 Tax=Aphidius gifuensis TaxID=684658 RepID=UPI001CDB85CE|nr:uncharacterized protein LOC122856520 [Aphidius gifuensis]
MQEEAFHDSSADLTQDDQICLDHFTQTHSRTQEGRYIVKLPFKSNEFFNYSKSKQHAELMLKRQEVRFAKDPQLHQLYSSFLTEYEKLGHMMPSRHDVDIRTICYLPHHGVKKESSSTTKLRLVFNGSQLIDKNESLNDLLYDGPCLLNNLSDVITRWRRYKIVFSADVEKMYRQIFIHEDDQEKQRILWRPTPTEQIKSYTLKTVTYGLKPAPFLALTTLRQLEKDEECMEKIEQLRALFKAGGFPLKKWLSNNDTILSVVPPEDREQSSTLNIQDVEVFKQLGVQWHRKDDTFTFSSPSVSNNTRLNATKREVLSKVAQLFDPLGWITPVIIIGKIFLQKLWNKRVDWDEQLDNELQLEWQTYCKHLQDVNCLKIPRWLHTAPDNLSVEIHGFSDASNVALGAAVYLRVKRHNNIIISTLVLAKSKNSFNSETTPVKWHHDNPADLASRGLQPKQLSTNLLWWHGPLWLCQEQDMWPTLQATHCDKTIDIEIKPVLTASVTTQQDTDNILEQLLVKHSSLNKMVGVCAWCLKFLHKTKMTSATPKELVITTEEYDTTLLYFIKHTQHQYFSHEISALKNHEQLPKSSSLIRLTPYLDKEGVLRVGSRLNNANLTQSATHQIILPIKSKLTTLILESIHKSTLHGSPQLMLATARQKYWIIGGRIPFQSVYWKCVICTRQRALVNQQLMGQLPPARCNPNPAFINTGVDFAGPFILKKWLGRCKQTYKAYIAVFVCFATSATHLEVVNGLSTEEFIAAYRRFTSLRGVCKNLYSDCGTNFVGAIKELRSLNTQAHNMCDFAHQLSLEGTNWHLNPPGAPHQGGKWEAGVKSMKHHLSRIMGATLYTYHQLDTLVKQISAQLNSRPLCPMTNDPNDLEALTPGHFLIGRAMTAIPERQLIDINDDEAVMISSTLYPAKQKLKMNGEKLVKQSM